MLKSFWTAHCVRVLFSYGVFSCGALRARASLFMGADFDPRDEVAVLKFWARRVVVGADPYRVSASLFVNVNFDVRGEAAVLKFSSTFFKRWRVQGQRPWWRRFFL